MKEADYLLAQDLTRLRIATDVMREVLSIPEEVHKDIMQKLVRERDKLFNRVIISTT